ncbi:MAG: hypothetical protein M3176_02045 [Chloroflexota bacterium]|nr:hypothetical protein [Chloroflexota bacterium]
MKRQFGLITVLVLVATFVFGSAGTVGAAGTTVVVTPTNTQGWSTADTRPGGAVTFVNGDAPTGGGTGSLQLTTTSATTAKAQYLHDASTPLVSVTELSYYTKQVSASFSGGDASYQLPVCLDGVSGTVCNGFTTFVFEPYENGTVVPGAWQYWNVAAGHFWSSRTYSVGTCKVDKSQGAFVYTLSQIKAMCPNAVVTGFGVNIGSNNPSYNVKADLVNFNGTTYNFELYSVPTDKNQCKDGGYKTFNPPTGPFKNQGQCVSYVENHETGQHGDGGDGGNGHHNDGGDDQGNGND